MRRWVTGLPSRRIGFIIRPVLVRFAVENVTVGQTSVRVLYFLLSRSRIPSSHQRYILIHLSRPLYVLTASLNKHTKCQKTYLVCESTCSLCFDMIILTSSHTCDPQQCYSNISLKISCPETAQMDFHFSESGILGVVWCLLSTVRKIFLVLSLAQNQFKNKPHIRAKVSRNLPNTQRRNRKS
jgi:hypothetical protein